MKVILHGFGGRSSDFFKDSQNVFSEEPTLVPELTLDPKYRELSLWDLARGLIKEIKMTATRPRLLAYSMGARVAWHMLILEPTLFRSAVMVAGHPGLQSLSEQKERSLWEQSWAEKWERGDWISTWREWCSLDVFGAVEQSTWGPARGVLRWKDFDPRFLKKIFAETLRRRGLGSQANLWPQLHKIETPVLWVSGKNDIKYDELGAILKAQNSRFQCLSVSGCGHRVLWDATERTLEGISRFELSQSLC